MKIWLKLVLVLAAGTLMFSSCLETIEPAGIEDLRGAKADLLRAQSALQEAQAAKVNAEAALVMAEAKVQEAIAKQKEAEIAYIEIEIKKMEAEIEYQNLLNEREAIKNAALEAANAAEAEAARIANEKALAELEAYLAQIEAQQEAAALEAAKAAAQLEADLLDIQAQVLEAKTRYEIALKELTAAKADLSPLQKAFIAPYQAAFTLAQTKVDNLTDQLETAAENLAAAIAVVDKNKADKLALRWAEEDVIDLEAALAGAKEAAEIAKAALELDPKVTDWAAEKAELEAELDAMKKEKLEGSLEDEKVNEELQAKYDELVAAYLEYEDYTGYLFDELTGEFGIYPNYKADLYGPEIYIPAPKDEDGYYMFYPDFHVPAPAFKYGDADYYGVITDFDDEILNYGNINNEWYDANIRISEAYIEGYMKDAEDEFAEYEAAVAAYEAEDFLAYYDEYAPYAADETFVLADAIDEYNTALKAWRTAAEKYETEYQKYVFDNEVYQAKIDELNEAKIAAYAEADAKYYPAMQEADNKMFAADNAYDKADLAYTRALAAETTEIAAILDECQKPDTTTLRTDFEAMVGLTLTDEQKVVYNKLKAANDRVKEIRADRKAADDAWAKATETWTKAGAEFTKTTTDLSNAWSNARATADAAYDKAVADLDLDSSVPGMNGDYDSYLVGLRDEAQSVLQSAIDRINPVVNGVMQGNGQRYHMYVLSENSFWMGEFYNVPDFIRARDDEGEMIYDLAELSLDTIADADFFFDQIKDMADMLSSYFRIYGEWYNPEKNHYYTEIYVPVGKPENYPLSLPTYESFIEELEAIQNINDYLYEIAASHTEECAVAGGSGDYYGAYYITTTLANVFDQKIDIDSYTEDKNDLDKAAAHIEVLKAAKADFEAYVAAEEKRIDDLRAMVEAEWAENAEAIKAVEDAQIAYTAEMAEIERMVDHITMMIDTYIGTTDVEAFIADLEEAYADALEAVEEYEFELELAKDELELVKAGGEDALTAVELAQKAYDKLNAKLQKALAELEAAADALEEAMAKIGEGKVEEETPETPATPAE